MKIQQTWTDPKILDQVIHYENQLANARIHDKTTLPGPCPRYLLDQRDKNHCKRCDYLLLWHLRRDQAWGLKPRKYNKIRGKIDWRFVKLVGITLLIMATVAQFALVRAGK